MNINKITYYLSTGLLSVLLLFSSGMYFFNYEMIAETFTRFGYPTYIIYPLAIAKILGLIVLWYRRPRALMEWAYAGFFFDFILAFSAHIATNDGQYTLSAVAIILLILSYIFGNKLSASNK